MKNTLFSESNITKLMGIIGILAILVAPFIAVTTNFKWGGSGAGILLIGTYLEFSSFFSRNIWHRLLGVLVLLIVAVIAVIYTFIIISIANK